MLEAVPEVAGDSAGNARQSRESQECSGAVLGMLQGRDRGCHGAELEIQRLNRESGDLLRRYWGCQGCTAQCRERRGSKGRILDPGVATGRCRDAGGQCRGCCRADPGTLQGRARDTAGQSRGFQGKAGNARTDAGVPGMPWGSVRDTGGSAGDVAGQMWGFRGCRGAVPGLQESAPGLKGQIRGSRGCRGAVPGMQESAAGMPGMLQGRSEGPGTKPGMLKGRCGGPGAEAGLGGRAGVGGTSLGAADLSQLGGPLALVAPEEGVGVLQAAAEGQLPRLGLGAVAAHLVLAVGQHLRHGGAERAEPRRAEPGAGLRRRRRRRGGNPGGRMKSCIRGERGPPRRGAAPERRGPARPGQDRDGGPPRPVPGDRPPGTGTLPAAPGPAPERSPRHGLSLCSGVPPTTGCPYGEVNPCHSRGPPDTAGPSPGVQRCQTEPQHPAPVPQHPTDQKAQPSGFQASSHPASTSAPHLGSLPNTHPGTHSCSPIQRWDSPWQPHQPCLNPCLNPCQSSWPPRVHVFVHILLFCISAGMQGHTGVIMQVSVGGAMWGLWPQTPLVPLTLPWGLSVEKGKGYPLWGPEMGVIPVSPQSPICIYTPLPQTHPGSFLLHC